MEKYKYGRDARWTGEADTYTSSFSGTLKQRKASEKALAELLSRSKRKKKNGGRSGRRRSDH